jgi:protein-L-isoaspartate O-methyltransferase
MDAKLEHLNQIQREQVGKQWYGQQHHRTLVDIPLDSNGTALRDFIVEPGVWNPAITSAGRFARYIFEAGPMLCRDKKVLDVGTGTGVLGITAAFSGATWALLTDVSEVAVYNAAQNIENFKLTSCAEAEHSDLFSGVNGKFDLIIFNHPFFCDTPPSGDTIAASMLAPVNLIKQFLTKAPFHLSSGGTILMPFYSLAGTANDPNLRGPEFGFKVEQVLREEATTGLQRGEIFVYLLTRG